ncbi:MAG: LptF/LptG family permease [Rikenellaceae bacterium]|nr:LptF/LptG family permease [Rikenellaceae bacterium]
MKTVHKLILKSYLGPMFLTFFIVMFVLLMNFMWRYIDELVGKGLQFSVILELMMYVSGTIIPTALPLATLLAAIMTLGGLGENYELLALKAAGISLPRILRPLIVVVSLVAIGSFFVANNYVPYSQKKMYGIINDIRKQKQTIEFKDGIFFNSIDDMSIRIEKQHAKTGLLENVLIYDNRKTNGDMTTTIADSGYIRISDDKKYLLVTLYHGETYEESRNVTWNKMSSLRHHIFDRQDGVIPLEGFSMERSDTSGLSSSKTKNIKELTVDIDSIQNLVDQSLSTFNNRFLANSVFTYNKELAYDSLDRNERHIINVMDSIPLLNRDNMAKVVDNALKIATNARSYTNFDEESTKNNISQLYRYQIEWHRMLALPVSIMIFFLIGAPLGAIIRKGGMGMPIVISVIFFVVYYIISITGEKMAREGALDSFRGMWLATFILTPIAVFLTYKATNDSNLFNAEWYLNKYKKIKGFFMKNKKSDETATK